MAAKEQPRFRFSVTLAVQVVAWLVSALLAYGAINTRVAVIENRVDAIGSDLAEIKRDVKELLRGSKSSEQWFDPKRFDPTVKPHR